MIVAATPKSDLLKYNEDIFRNFVSETDEENLESKLNTFIDDLWFVLENIATNDCPNSILVIHHDKENNGLNELFNFINRVMNPDKEIFDLLEIKKKEMDDFFKKFERNKPGIDLNGGYKE